MLHEQGFEHFYDLKASQNLAPVPPQALRDQDYTWLETLVAARECGESCTTAELTLSVQGLSCLGCIWLIERLYDRLGGARVLVDINRIPGLDRIEQRGNRLALGALVRRARPASAILVDKRPTGAGDHRETPP